MVTPVTESGDVDREALRTYTNELVEGGVHGLFPVGSTGEFSSLTREQRSTVIEIVAEQSGERPVLAGCGGTSLANVKRYLSDAAAAGADVGVVVTPFYLETTQESLRRYYERLADDAPIPFYLYNIPQRTGICLGVETIAGLAERSEIVGIKDSTGDFTYCIEILDSVPDIFEVFQGIPTLAAPSLDLDADGVIAGPANIFPSLVSEFYDAYQLGDNDRVHQILQNVIAPIITTIQSIPSPVAFKYLLSKAGLEVGDPLSPLPSLSRAQRQRLNKCFQNVIQAESKPIFC